MLPDKEKEDAKPETSRSAPSNTDKRKPTMPTHSIQNNQGNRDSEEEDPEQACASIIIGTIKSTSTTCKAFAVLQAYLPSPEVRSRLRLKIDTGAAGNTLSLRMYYQMFHDTPTTQTLTPEPKVKLTSYSGDIIPCLGSIQLGPKTKGWPIPV